MAPAFPPVHSAARPMVIQKTGRSLCNTSAVAPQVFVCLVQEARADGGSHFTSSAVAWCLGPWTFLLARTSGHPAPLDHTVHAVTPFPDLPPEKIAMPSLGKQVGSLKQVTYFFSPPAREQQRSINQP